MMNLMQTQASARIFDGDNDLKFCLYLSLTKNYYSRLPDAVCCSPNLLLLSSCAGDNDYVLLPVRFSIVFDGLLGCFGTVLRLIWAYLGLFGPILTQDMDGGGPARTFDTLTVDVWIKWLDVTGEHPIMNEDHWDTGALHYQIYGGRYGFDVNGAGDQTFIWQPQPLIWYYLTVVYQSLGTGDNPNSIMLYVNNQFQETIGQQN